MEKEPVCPFRWRTAHRDPENRFRIGYLQKPVSKINCVLRVLFGTIKASGALLPENIPEARFAHVVIGQQFIVVQKREDTKPGRGMLCFLS